MRKTLSLVLSVLMILSAFTFQTAFAADDIKVTINGQNLTMDQPPVLVNDRTLVPVRAIFEALGAKVDWNNDTNTATGVLGSTTVEIQIENTVAKVNGKDVTLDVPAKLISDRTLVPVRFISESLGAKVDWDNDTQTVIITTTSAGGALLDLTFDSLTKFENKTDFITGASYDVKQVSLSKDVDHTTGSGQSLKLDNRTKSDHRVKFVNSFKGAQKGATYVVSAYVYAPEAAEKVGIGVYGDVGTSTAFMPAKHLEIDVPAKTWTKLEMEYTYDNEEITQVGIDQRPADVKCAPVLYVDDVKVVANGGATTPSTPSTPAEQGKTLDTLVLAQREGKRPTPVITNTGKTYDDLIFYNRDFESAEKNKVSSEEMFNALPKNPVVISTEDDLLNSTLSGKEYSNFEIADVDGMPFKKAIKATVKTVPIYSYSTQMVLPSMDQSKFKTGDRMLLIFYMKTEKVDNEAGVGQVQCIVEQEVAPNSKSLKEDVKSAAGDAWHKVYLPFIGSEGYTRLCVRLGFYPQTVQFGGYQILNYGSDIDFDKLPSDTVMEVSDKRELFDRNDAWRKEAWDRIEKIRKGDIKVIVKDAAGNVIPDADVKLDMYDHEFMWGTAINGTVHADKKYQKAISALFNTGVAETSFKPAELYLKPEAAMKEYNAAMALGLKNFRGHTLVWDRPLSRTYDQTKGEWIKNTTVTEELAKLTIANDKAGIDAYIENMIKTIEGQFDGKVCDWDVVNELLNNNEIRTRFGNGVLNDWFKWANKYDTHAKKYINETGITGYVAKTDQSESRLQDFMQVLDYMTQNGVEFDGIGIQGHFGTYVNPETFYDQLKRLQDKYNKEMKVTEYDVNLDMDSSDPEAAASFMRDIMIGTFSLENATGFLMWGFTDAHHWLKSAPVFDKDYNIKKSGEQYLDLVYNKWWTQEDGKTTADGSYQTRGYYGDYLITASANGKSKTVDVKCYKGADNTITITLD